MVQRQQEQRRAVGNMVQRQQEQRWSQRLKLSSRSTVFRTIGLLGLAFISVSQLQLMLSVQARMLANIQVETKDVTIQRVASLTDRFSNETIQLELSQVEPPPRPQGSFPFPLCLGVGDCYIHFPLSAVTPEAMFQPWKPSFSSMVHNFTNENELYMLTQKGVKHEIRPNQDRSVAISMPGGFLAGLFDGHGRWGHKTAEVAMDDLLHILWPTLLNATKDPNVLSSEAQIRRVFTRAFLKVDRGRAINFHSKSGSTGIVVWQRGRRIVLASVGDSTAMIGHWNGTGTQVLAETIHHKPSDPNEVARITALGGNVSVPDWASNPRVIVGNRALVMTRMFGDKYAKGGNVLTAEPAIQVLDVPPGVDKVFLVLASDGTVDYFNTHQVANAIGSSFYDPQQELSVAQMCRHLMKEGSRRWHERKKGKKRDDMTLTVATLSLG